MADAHCSFTKPETTAKLTKQLGREPHPTRTPQQAKESVIRQDSTHPKPHPLLYTSNASCCEQNRPDGYPPETVMACKAD
ncbi:hypothetical protein NC651_033624 [Populus alba x Populus x berolinensis]|nr:hypothetical protein NC651_033624 [Populus alba x Populus x berolinensis]